MSNIKKTSRKSNTTRIAIWNLSGRLNEPCRQEELFADMQWKKVGFVALQEAMWNQDATVQGRNGEAIIKFQSTEAGYRGLGRRNGQEE